MSEQALEPRTKSLTHPALRPHELFGAQDAPCVDGLPLGKPGRHVWTSLRVTGIKEKSYKAKGTSIK